MPNSTNRNQQPDPFPAKFPSDKVRKSLDPDNGQAQRHERDIARLERLADRGKK